MVGLGMMSDMFDVGLLGGLWCGLKCIVRRMVVELFCKSSYIDLSGGGGFTIPLHIRGPGGGLATIPDSRVVLCAPSHAPGCRALWKWKFHQSQPRLECDALPGRNA